MKLEKYKLHHEALSTLAEVLHKGLSENFKDVVVEVVDCPDLSKEPFHLAAEGLCGSTRLVDIGGPPYLVPSPKRDKVYNLPEISKLIELPGAFMLGAGAGPCHYVGTNCEMMPNIKVGTNANEEVNNSYIAKVDEQNNSYILKKLDGCKDMCLLANLFACEGKRDKVLKIRAKRRIGEQNFVTCMRKCLNKQFGDKPIGLGGAFVIVNGKAKLHVMPDFSPCPLNSEDEVNKWLKFYEMQAPLVCLSEFVSSDPGLDLRIEHTHCFSNHGDGGHYHYDTTPNDVEYLGYYNIAEYMYRIDRPEVTHQLGRD